MPKTIFCMYSNGMIRGTYIAPELEDARHEVKFRMRMTTNTPAQYNGWVFGIIFVRANR